MKEAKVKIINEKLFIEKKEYPPTGYNLEVWNEYKITKDRNILKKLSQGVLDL